MKKNQKNIIIIVTILIFSGIFLLPVEVPYTIDSVAKIFPVQQWILFRGNDGEIFVNTENFVSSVNNSYQLTSFERGESIILNLDAALNDGEIVSKGDTLGVIHSSSQQEYLIQLKGELKVLKASLKVAMSGEKKTEIQESEQRLAVAKMELEKQTKIVKRLKESLQKEIISFQEYQTAEDEWNILAKEVNVRQAELESSLSGEKVEEINRLVEQISAVKDEISFLQEQVNSQNIIIAPFNGRIDRSFTNDTLLVLSNFDSGIACIPVPLEDAVYINQGEKVSFSSTFTEASLSGEVHMKQPVVQLVGGKQCITVLATVNPLSNDFVTGLLTQVKIDCGSVSVPTYLTRNILN